MRRQIYFLSDFHLPVFKNDVAKEREKKIIFFLEKISSTAKEIFLLGDIFDFWFEYKHVIPKGYVRLLGALAKLTDSGVVIHYFVGNHDMWLRNYFQQEIGIKVYYEPQEFILDNKNFYIGHGDGIGPKQWKYKALKTLLFQNKLLTPFFILLFHPDWLMPLGNLWSKQSRKHIKHQEKKYLGNNKEYLVQFCMQYLKKKHIDFFVFGHRHLSLNISLPNNSFYFNTGDMIKLNTYLIYNNQQIEMHTL